MSTSMSMSMNLTITIHNLRKMLSYPAIYHISTVKDPIIIIPTYMATVPMKSCLWRIFLWSSTLYLKRSTRLFIWERVGVCYS